MIRKIIIYVSIFAFCFCILPSTVSASGYDGNIVNLLPAASYQIRYGTSDPFESNSPGGRTHSSTAQVRWDNNAVSTNIDLIYFNIRATKTVTTLRFSDEGVSSPPAAEFVGMYDGLYQFKLSITSFNFSTFYMRIHFGSETNVDFLVESVYGIVNDSIPISRINQRSYFHDFYHTAEGAIPTQSVASYGIRTLPYSQSIGREVYPIVSTEWSYLANMIEIYPSNFDIKNVGKVSILLSANNISDFTVSLNVGGITDIIPCDIELMGTVDPWPDHPEDFYFWAIQYYEVTFDVTGYDLTGDNCCFFIYFDNEPYYYDNSYQYVYWSIKGAWYQPVVIDVPWYQTMWTWIKGGFTSVTDTLQSLLGDSSGGALGEAAGEMTQQADEMDQANEVLNNVQRPDLDPDEILGDSLNFSPGGMMVLTSLTNNPIITSLLIAVCSFALVGYIFFGKR